MEAERRHSHHRERERSDRRHEKAREEHRNHHKSKDERYEDDVDRKSRYEDERNHHKSERHEDDRSHHREKSREEGFKRRDSQDSKRKRESQDEDSSKRSRVSPARVESPRNPVVENDEHEQSRENGTNHSADAVEKAKRLLEIKKQLAEKMKKLEPELNKVATTKKSTPAQQETTDVAPNAANLAAYRKAQECVARLGFQQPAGSTVLQIPGAPPAAPKVVRAPVLRLDAQGREIDENGNVIDRRLDRQNISTLKVNINKQKKEAFQILHPELEADPVNSPHFDTGLKVDKTKLVRKKRSNFQFVEQGLETKKADLFRLNNRFGAAKAKEIRSKQAALAKAKAEGDINPNLIEVTERIFKEDKQQKDPIPPVEWWDLKVLPAEIQSYEEVMDETEIKYKKDKINIYVEHPVPIEPPAEPAPPPPQPLKLTKKEQKKIRTQRRLAREKERQELIRQGAIEPPKNKVKMSNLMKVLGAEATQDPTRLEQEIRSAVAERERAHSDRNLARKLTPAERREKKEKRLFDDPSTLETIVAVFRVNDISDPKKRFKVDINAQENRLTGCAISTDSMTVIIVEGGVKSIKRYAKLMLRRINWSAKEDGEENEEEEEEGSSEKKENKCVQVWQGSVARPAFDRFFFQKFHTAGAARKYLADAGVGHYWDSALNYNEE